VRLLRLARTIGEADVFEVAAGARPDYSPPTTAFAASDTTADRAIGSRVLGSTNR